MVVNNSGQGALGAGMGNATIVNPAQQPSALGQIGAGLGDIFSGLMGAGQSILSSPDALTGIAGGLLTREAYDRLSGVGEQARREAMGIAERGQMESEFRPFTVTTPTGAMFTARIGGQPFGQPMAQPIGQPSMALLYDKLKGGGQMYAGGTPNFYGQTDPTNIGKSGQVKPSGQYSGGFMGQDRQVYTPPTTPPPGQVMGINRPALPEQPMAPAGEGLEIGMTLSPEEQALQRQLLGGAGGFFGQAVQPTVDREQAVFERIRAAQRPEEERQRLALEERLAAQGRLGTSSAAFGGATPELMAQQTAIGEARNRAILSAMQQAQAEQAQQAALGQQLLGAGYLPQQQLVAALQPSLIQQELAQQAQQFGTGLFGETALSGIEAQLLAEQARANLLGGIGTNLITGLMNQQRAAAAQPSGGGASGLGGLFGDIVEDLGTVGSGIGRLLGIGD